MVRDAGNRSARRVRAMAGLCPEKETTVQKKEKMKKTKTVLPASHEQRPKWSLLLAGFHEAINWGLDAAARLARGFPDEIETVERVRAFVNGRIAGNEVPIELDDLLFTFAVALAALEVEQGTPGTFAVWIEKQPIRVTSATDLERQWIEQLLWTYEAVQNRLRLTV